MDTMSKNNEMIEQTNRLSKMEYDRKADKDNDKKYKMGKLHASVKEFILNAASTDGEFAAKEVPESCSAVFNQDSASMSEREILVRLRQAGCPNVGFAHGTTQALLTGQFLYFEPGFPSNFSMFSFYKKLVDAHDCKKRMLLHIHSKDGKSKSNDEINESLKQVVVVPASITQLVDQVEIFSKVIHIFFGNDKSYRAFVKLGKRIVREESELLHAAATDSKLPAKIAYAADKRNQRWMKQNELATDREEDVDDTLLSFEDVIEDALNDRLMVRLSAAFKEVPNDGGEHPNYEPRGRKRKEPSEDDDDVVSN